MEEQAGGPPGAAAGQGPVPAAARAGPRGSPRVTALLSESRGPLSGGRLCSRSRTRKARGRVSERRFNCSSNFDSIRNF